MKIRTKITLLISIFIVVLIAAISSVAVITIESNAENEIANYRQVAILETQNALMEKIDVVYNMIDKEMQQTSSRAFIQKNYGERVKNIIELANTILDSYQQQYKNGHITLAQAQALAREKIKALRYDAGVGYVWIQDTAYPFPNMIMHPTNPALDGKALNNTAYNTALGQNANLFVAAMEVATEKGAGFIDYMWPKPTANGLTKMQPKISYVALYKPWNWVVGTGIYVDEARSDAIVRLEDTIKHMRFGKFEEGYFWVNDTTLPVPYLILNPITPEWNHKIIDDPKFLLKDGSKQNLFTAFVEAVNKSKNGRSFFSYKWPKITGQGIINDVDKMSALRLYKPLNWVIGSGIYLDDLEKTINKRKQELKAQADSLVLRIGIAALILLLISILISMIFSNGMSRAIMQLTQIADDISTGKNLDQVIEATNRKDEIGQLARAIERLQTSVSITMKRLLKR